MRELLNMRQTGSIVHCRVCTIDVGLILWGRPDTEVRISQ
jgi:hypothetical protein